MHKQNLLRLADHLDNLPPDYAHFDMMEFVDTHSLVEPYPEGVPEVLHNCGTVACAVGHATVVPGLEPLPDEHWDAYTNRLFGLDREMDAFNYMFGSQWTNVDNTPTGAAARIRNYVTNGLPS